MVRQLNANTLSALWQTSPHSRGLDREVRWPKNNDQARVSAAGGLGIQHRVKLGEYSGNSSAPFRIERISVEKIHLLQSEAPGRPGLLVHAHLGLELTDGGKEPLDCLRVGPIVKSE